MGFGIVAVNHVDIIIGSQYMRYFPKIVFELDTGSRILESKFVSTFLFLTRVVLIWSDRMSILC